MATIRVGHTAPNVTLETIDDRPVNLSQAWDKNHHALIIFLRHLA